MNRPLPYLAVLFAATFAALPALHAQQPTASPFTDDVRKSSPGNAAQPPVTAQPAAAPAAVQDVRIVFHTDKGDIDATLFATKAPLTVANFLNLAQQKFYDGLKFHRVIQEFMIQGGDPSGNGTGGPGYQFEDEKNDTRKFDKPGVIAMANRGTNTNGSQFFITHGAYPSLNDGAGSGHYTIFGQVTKGQEIVNAIAQGDRIKSIDILDSTTSLFAAQATQIVKWNAQLTKGSKH